MIKSSMIISWYFNDRPNNQDSQACKIWHDMFREPDPSLLLRMNGHLNPILSKFVTDLEATHFFSFWVLTQKSTWKNAALKCGKIIWGSLMLYCSWKPLTAQNNVSLIPIHPLTSLHNPQKTLESKF